MSTFSSARLSSECLTYLHLPKDPGDKEELSPPHSKARHLAKFQDEG